VYPSLKKVKVGSYSEIPHTILELGHGQAMDMPSKNIFNIEKGSWSQWDQYGKNI
jgi:hypothetical protein